MNQYNGISFFGIFVLMLVAWSFSGQKKIINWRLIAWGIGFQLLFALFIFYIPAGIRIFKLINDIALAVLNSALAGAEFVFGRLAIPPGTTNAQGESSLGFSLAFQAFPTIIFFSALMSVLYFLKIMPLIIKLFARIFSRIMRISGAESLCAASNIFVGLESAFTIKPHLTDMTRSELFTVLTVSMSTVASNVLALYVFSLKDQFPMIAGHLISASFLSIPAALIMSKLMMPESDRPKTLGVDIEPHYEKEDNIFMAVINGANAGVKFIVGIVALLITVISMIALINLGLSKIGLLFGGEVNLSLQHLLGYVFYPFTLIMGVPLSDVDVVSRIVGERIILTEVTAYQDLALAIKQGTLQNPRSIIITTYALCGFTHLASMAIFIGGIAAIIPKRIQLLTQIGFKALIAATLACLMTACIAGIFASNSSILLGG
jgi:CNT family concentrative nucleoside transporter